MLALSKLVQSLALIHFLSWALAFTVQQEGENVRNQRLIEFLVELNHRQRYQTVLLENCAANSFDKDIWVKMETPMIQLRSATQYQKELKILFNHNLLVMVCVERNVDSFSIIGGLARQLQHIRDTHVILLAEADAEVHQEQVVEKLFRHCQVLQILNVIALFSDFISTHLVLTFDAFPTFKLTAVPFMPFTNYFPDKTRQLHGHPIYTEPDQNQPRSFLYRDLSGALKMSGYIGKLVEAFGQHLNATLRFPRLININETIYQRDQHNSTRSGVIDFATSLSSYRFFAPVQEFTYPFEFAKWLIMLPVERDLEVNEISGRTFWGALCCPGQVFRGILGQTFPMCPHNNWRMSYIYFTIFLVGLITSCLFAVYLKTFLTQPPTKSRISSFEDLIKSDIRCLVNEKEVPIVINLFGAAAWSRYKDGFEIISSWSKFLSLRLSLNTTYGYTVTTSLWPFIQLKQSLRRRKLFRLATDFILDDWLILGMPINENSIYKPALNRFIALVNEAGLINHWQVMTYYDMKAIGAINLDYNVDDSRQYNILVPSDFYWMAWMFGFGTYS
ncbi:uncharacterized protein LOC120772992 [Bactrocera tryoni]|uniref:uncharacterized protein LOC120772992 n=1 Tax=Bactrocera tryoni TaxID=59916 RepID=UPI001A962BC7|nr:uncharacterized protein LOC120772992 [Bactrocera tryoni]